MIKKVCVVVLLLAGLIFAQQNAVVAKVNDDIVITLDEVQREIGMLSQEDLEIVTTKEGVRQVVDQIIQRKLLSAEAQELKLDTVSIVERAIQRAKDIALADFLLINVQQQVPKVTVDEAKQYYTENESVFYSFPVLDLRQIVLATPDEAKLVKEALESGKDFEKVMKDYPGIPGGAQSGDLGKIGLNLLNPNIANQLVNVEKGKWAGPFQTESGYHFIYVIDREEPEKLQFDDISENLIQQLTNVKINNTINNYVQQMVDASTITIDNANLKEAIVPRTALPQNQQQGN